MRNRQYGEGFNFPIIRQSGGRGGNTQRMVNFTTKSGKRLSFKASNGKRRRRQQRKRRRRSIRQQGRGVVPEYLTKEFGEIAGSFGRAAVTERMSEGVNVVKKGICFLKNKLSRKRTKKVTPAILQQVPWID